MKTKTLKAWAILKHNLKTIDRMSVPSARLTGDLDLLGVFPTKAKAEEMTFGPDKRIVKCTISFTSL